MVVGATAAHADDAPGKFDYRQGASSSAGVGQIFNNTNNQTAGLVAINVTAGNIQFGNANASTQQWGAAFYPSKLRGLSAR